jgi:Putative collagen-binding domain of a collagenase
VNHKIVVSGYGTFSPRGDVNQSDYVTTASTPDGRLAIAYLPVDRPVQVDMSKLSGPVQARWYDPTKGSYVPVIDSPFAAAGTRSFSPPGSNASGDDDWVLVLSSR